MVLHSVLVELYNRNGQRSLRVIEGQGVTSLNIRFERDARDTYPLGSVFKMDLRLHSTGKYYVSAYSGQTLDSTYFGQIEDEAVKQYIEDRGGTAPSFKPEPRPDTSDNVPPVPSGIRINSSTWEFINHAVELGQYPLLVGPKGCGKSSVARALAEARGLEFFEFDMGQVAKPNRFFLGGMAIGDEGKTVKVRSEFFKAFTSEKPTLIFLDEITRIQTGASNFLMTVLARNQSFLYDQDLGVRYYKGENVTFITAGNVGYQYTTTGRLDSAFSDRFVKIQVDYLEKGQEKALILERYHKVTAIEAEQLANAAAALRAAEKKKSLSVSLSTRQVLMAASYIELGYTVSQVIQNVILQNYLIEDEVKEATAVLQAL